MEIPSLDDFITEVKNTAAKWRCSGNHRPWYRGQPDCSLPPVPRLFRKVKYDEFNLCTTFRNRAQGFNRPTPHEDRLDQWLFLMQHFGCPTRLLDWTESPLIALFFAVYQKSKSKPGIWMIDPLKLNESTLGLPGFPNSWVPRKPGTVYFCLAFNPRSRWNALGSAPPSLPAAVQPTHFDPRMSAQKAVVTIHGTEEQDFERLVLDKPLIEKGFFRKYVVTGDHDKILKDLDYLGISDSTVFPDFEGLARDFEKRFRLGSNPEYFKK